MSRRGGSWHWYLASLVMVMGLNMALALPEEILTFLQDNGRKYVNIVSSNKLTATAGAQLENASFYLQHSRLDDFDDHYSFVHDTNVFVHEWNQDDLGTTLALITTTKRKRSVLYIKDIDVDDGVETIRTILSNVSENALFYLCLPKGEVEPEGYNWYYILTVKGQTQVVVNALDFFDNSTTIRETYNLQGMPVTSTSLNWSPYLELRDCTETGLNCTNYGFLKGLTDVLAERLNFTMVSTRDPDFDWGLEPKSGPFNLSGEWGGVMGNVVNGKYPVSLSQWYYIYQRNEILDFVTTTADFEMVALTPQPAPVDTGLFIRPFRHDAWTAVVGMCAFIVTVLLVPYTFIAYFEYSTGFMVANLSAWYFFVLLNAFYGGALTMFFSSEQRVPFENIRDVMRAYPDWNLIMIDGNDALFISKAARNDPDFLPYWEKVKEDRDLYVVPSVTAGLNRLANERLAMHALSGQLKGFFRNNPFHQQQLMIFGREKPRYNALVFTKNSPLATAFDYAVKMTRESGTIEQLLTNWEGKQIRSNVQVEKMVLSPGQTVLVYFVVGMGIFVALGVLGGELIHKRLFSHVDPLGLLENSINKQGTKIMLKNKANKKPGRRKNHRCLSMSPEMELQASNLFLSPQYAHEYSYRRT